MTRLRKPIIAANFFSACLNIALFATYHNYISLAATCFNVFAMILLILTGGDDTKRSKSNLTLPFMKSSPVHLFCNTNDTKPETVLEIVTRISETVSSEWQIVEYTPTDKERNEWSNSYAKWKVLHDLKKETYGSAYYGSQHYIPGPNLPHGYRIVIADESEALAIKLAFSEYLTVIDADGSK